MKETPKLTVIPQLEEDVKLPNNKKPKEKEKSPKKDTKSDQAKSPPKNKTSKQEPPQEPSKKSEPTTSFSFYNVDFHGSHLKSL